MEVPPAGMKYFHIDFSFEGRKHYICIYVCIYSLFIQRTKFSYKNIRPINIVCPLEIVSLRMHANTKSDLSETHAKLLCIAAQGNHYTLLWLGSQAVHPLH